LAIDFFLFALISQNSICFLERRILKGGREERKDKNRESFFALILTMHFVEIKKKIHLSLSHHSLKSLSLAEGISSLYKSPD